MYRCPVCAYREMPDPPEDFNICPCCGTEFGYTNAGITFEQVRRKWISHGFPWFYGDAPENWNPERQLLDAGYGYSLAPSETFWVADTVGDFELKTKSDTADEYGVLEVA